MARHVKIATYQYTTQEIKQFDDLANRVKALLDQTDNAELVLFPELFTIELFTTLPNWKNRPISDLVEIAQFTDQYKTLFLEEAKKRGQYIVGGSHLEKVAPKDGEVERFENIGHIFCPDGTIFSHSKTHIFPAEAGWHTSEGDKMEVFKLPFAKVGFNICYETEIPECSASLAEQGVEIILTPSATFTEQGFWRVRHSAHARCIENQVYLAHCALGGTPSDPLPNGWARSGILSPCDLAWDNPMGVIAECETHKETVAVGVVDLDLLYENRESGAATTFKDRRRQAHLYKKWASHL